MKWINESYCSIEEHIDENFFLHSIHECVSAWVFYAWTLALYIRCNLAILKEIFEEISVKFLIDCGWKNSTSPFWCMANYSLFISLFSCACSEVHLGSLGNFILKLQSKQIQWVSLRSVINMPYDFFVVFNYFCVNERWK